MTLPFSMPGVVRPANAVTIGPPAPAIDPDSPRAGIAYPVRHDRGWEKWAFVADALRGGEVDDLPVGTRVLITKRSIRWVLVAVPALVQKPMIEGQQGKRPPWMPAYEPKPEEEGTACR